MCIDEAPHKKNWRLYYLLDLIAPVTAKQIKWNFRKVTLRHHYYQAYLVLYSKSRKFLYDATGEDGYGFITSGTWGPFVNLCGSTGAVIFYAIFMLVQIAMLILFFAFLGARVDKHISWNWESVVAPLIVFGVLALIITLFAMILNFTSRRTYSEGMSVMDRLSPVGNFVAAICYFCIPIVIGYKIKLNPGSQVGNFMKYMAMPILGDFFYYLTSLIWRWPRRIRLQMKVDDNEPSPGISYGIFVLGFLNMFAGIAQWACIGCKLDKKIKHTWYVVFIPFCFRCAFRIAEACMRSMMKYTIGVRTAIGVAFDTVGSFFVNGMLLTSLYFVAARIELGKDEVEMPRALIPVYIVLAYIFLALIFTFIFVLCRISSKRAVEDRINASWTPPPERAEGAGEDTGSTSNPSGPIRSVSKGSDGWNGLDDTQTVSSAAFPEGYSNSRATPAAAADEPYYANRDGEYEDFYTDEEDDLFPEEETVEETPRSEMLPYGSPHDEEYSQATHTSSHQSRRSAPVSQRSAPASQQSAPVSQRSAPVSQRSAPSRSAGSASQGTPASRGRPATHLDEDSDGSYYSYTEQTTYIDEEGSEGSYTEETSYIDEEDEEAVDSRMSHTASSAFSSSSHSTPRQREL